MSMTYFLVSLTNNSNSRATIVVLTTTSSTVKINDNSRTNISKNQAFQREAGILLPAFRDGWSLVSLLHPF